MIQHRSFILETCTWIKQLELLLDDVIGISLFLQLMCFPSCLLGLLKFYCVLAVVIFLLTLFEQFVEDFGENHCNIDCQESACKNDQGQAKLIQTILISHDLVEQQIEVGEQEQNDFVGQFKVFVFVPLIEFHMPDVNDIENIQLNQTHHLNAGEGHQSERNCDEYRASDEEDQTMPFNIWLVSAESLVE